MPQLALHHRNYHLSSQGVIIIDIPAESLDHGVGHTPSKQILRRLAYLYVRAN